MGETVTKKSLLHGESLFTIPGGIVQLISTFLQVRVTNFTSSREIRRTGPRRVQFEAGRRVEACFRLKTSGEDLKYLRQARQHSRPKKPDFRQKLGLIVPTRKKMQNGIKLCGFFASGIHSTCII